LSENDSNGYYKYALGEVFLVMVAILLALQVDNWNEVRKEKKQETDILINLQNEIRAIHHIMERVKKNKMQVVSAGKNILEYTGELATWNSTLIQAEDDVYRSELHNYFLPFIGRHYPTWNVTSQLDFRNLDFNLSNSNFASKPEALLRNPEFESLLTTQQICFTLSIRFYENLGNKYRTILNLIENEISG
jgi:hypothetical protein